MELKYVYWTTLESKHYIYLKKNNAADASGMKEDSYCNRSYGNMQQERYG